MSPPVGFEPPLLEFSAPVGPAVASPRLRGSVGTQICATTAYYLDTRFVDNSDRESTITGESIGLYQVAKVT